MGVRNFWNQFLRDFTKTRLNSWHQHIDPPNHFFQTPCRPPSSSRSLRVNQEYSFAFQRYMLLTTTLMECAPIRIQHFAVVKSERDPLLGFSVSVRPHFLGWTVFDRHFPMSYAVVYKEHLVLEMICPLATGNSPVFLEKDDALVVLIDTGPFDIVALCFNELQRPQDHRDDVVDPDQLCLA